MKFSINILVAKKETDHKRNQWEIKGLVANYQESECSTEGLWSPGDVELLHTILFRHGWLLVRDKNAGLLLIPCWHFHVDDDENGWTTTRGRFTKMQPRADRLRSIDVVIIDIRSSPDHSSSINSPKMIYISQICCMMELFANERLI